MKQMAFSKLFIRALVILALFSIVHCSPDKPSHEEVAEQYLAFINGGLPGSRIETDLKKCEVEPIENNRYRITLRDCIFTTDLTWIVGAMYKNLIQKEDHFRNVEASRVKEIVALYDPVKKFSSLLSMKGMIIELDMSGLTKEHDSTIPGGIRMQKAFVTIGKGTFENLHITPDRENGDAESPGESRKTDGGNSPSSGSELEDIKLEINGWLGNGEKLWVLLELDGIESVDSGLEDPYTTTYLFEQDAPRPDLPKILQKGLAISDLKVDTGEITISIKVSGADWGSGSIGNVSYSQFVKPDETGAFFKGGHAFGVKNANFTIPGRRDIEMSSRIKDLRYVFSMERLSPEVVMAFMDLLKMGIGQRDLAGGSNMQQLIFQGMQLQTEFAKSKSLVNFSISPFEHYFGKMDANAAMRLRNFFEPPELKLKVDLPEIDNTLEKMRAADILAPPELDRISGIVEEYAVRKENGDASIDIELSPEHPGMVIVNGTPRKLGFRGF